MISIIVTVVAVVLATLFALLVKFWVGFAYFVLTTLLLLSLFWGVWLIIKYFTTYKEELNEKFKFYKADKLNNNNITAEEFENNLSTYKKDFSKIMLKEKILKWLVVLFCFALAFTFLFGIIFY